MRSGGPGKVRDKFCEVEASPGRPQDGRGVGVGPEDFLEEEGSTLRPEEGGAGQAMMGPGGGRWAASLGLGDCTRRGGESSGSLEVVVSALLGVGGSRAPGGGKPQRVGPALRPWLPTLLAMGTGNGGAQRDGGTSALLVVDGGGRDGLKDGEMPVGGAASKMWAGLRAGVGGHRPRCPQGRLLMSHW